MLHYGESPPRISTPTESDGERIDPRADCMSARGVNDSIVGNQRLTGSFICKANSPAIFTHELTIFPQISVNIAP